MSGGGRHRKNALIIAPSFFGYEQAIVEEFNQQGHATILIDDRPSNTPLIRAIVRARKSLLTRKIDDYYHRWLRELRGREFDLVLVVKGEAVPPWFLDALRASNEHSQFVYYTYDTLEPGRDGIETHSCFNKLYSFDRTHAERDPNFDYLPLFYTKDFYPLPGNPERQNSVTFVGTLHSGRYGYAKRFCKDRPKTFTFFYSQARWYFFLTKFLTREQRAAKWEDVSFKKLSRAEVGEIFRNSKAVLDLPRSGQSGLTMRTFETLASGAILITTNPAITREPFYDKSRVIVVPADPDDEDLETAWGKLDALSNPSGIPEPLLECSLTAWVAKIESQAAESEGQ